MQVSRNVDVMYGGALLLLCLGVWGFVGSMIVLFGFDQHVVASFVGLYGIVSLLLGYWINRAQLESASEDIQQLHHELHHYRETITWHACCPMDARRLSQLHQAEEEIVKLRIALEKRGE